jgi:SAM-dependent methyltransferase
MFMKWTIIFAFLLLAVISYRFLYPRPENFDQREPFVMKRNEDALDDFYIELYDPLHDVNSRTNEELIHILRTTDPSTQHSVFLDVGSGTGNIVNELTDAGYKAYGVEKCQNMVDYSQKQYPDIEVLKGDVLEPMMFEKNTFTHVLCTYFTIYQIQNKLQFFRNCYHWMQPGGYLVIHVVDKDKFERIIPNKDAIAKRESRSGQSVLNIKAIFNDYEYKGSFEIPKQSNHVIMKETLTDNETRHIRQNETDLYMEDTKQVLEIAKYAGFINHAKTSMKDMNGDEYQYLYYFERPL